MSFPHIGKGFEFKDKLLHHAREVKDVEVKERQLQAVS